jgi:hypothetical protein
VNQCPYIIRETEALYPHWHCIKKEGHNGKHIPPGGTPDEGGMNDRLKVTTFGNWFRLKNK